jgi:hypothetical protein
MPRISKKTNPDFLKTFLDSDDEDDDDLLQPNVHLQPSQQSPDSSIEASSQTPTLKPAPVETKEKFEERGKKQNSEK